MLKWNVEPSRFGYALKQGTRTIAVMRDLVVAEAVAAAHNAVIDMAFDSPGNVS